MSENLAINQAAHNSEPSEPSNKSNNTPKSVTVRQLIIVIASVLVGIFIGKFIGGPRTSSPETAAERVPDTPEINPVAAAEYLTEMIAAQLPPPGTVNYHTENFRMVHKGGNEYVGTYGKFYSGYVHTIRVTAIFDGNDSNITSEALD